MKQDELSDSLDVPRERVEVGLVRVIHNAFVVSWDILQGDQIFQEIEAVLLLELLKDAEDVVLADEARVGHAEADED